MNNILSDFEHVFSCAVHIFEYIVCRVMYTGSKFLKIYMVYTERRVRVSCSVYDMLHTDAKCYIIMCKLVKLAFRLCCEPIDHSNLGSHKSELVARGANTQLDPSCVYQRLQRLTWIYSKYIVHALLRST